MPRYMVTDGVERAQRAEIEGDAHPLDRLELRRQKRSVADIVNRLENQLRIARQGRKRIQRAFRAAERLPEAERKLEEAKADFTLRPGMVDRAETELRETARRARFADEDSLARTETNIKRLRDWIDAIESGDANALIEATRYLYGDEAQE